MKEKKDRKLANRSDIIIIAALVCACVIAILLMNKKSGSDIIAQITYKNQIVKEIKLSNATDGIFKLAENPKVSFQISNHQIRFVDVSCPDKLCENFGYLKKSNEVAICLPNQVTLKLVGGEEETDAIVN